MSNRGSTNQRVEALMLDQRLVVMCELQRIGDEVLDVIGLSENQHSDVLAWLLDSREGHGQGDEILRDLLIAASTLAAEQRAASGTIVGGKTAEFFENWPPLRMKTTSFGAAFTVREQSLPGNGGRLDLLVVDPQNKFVLVIENKAGTQHTADQLNKYSESIRGLEKIKKYSVAFLAIDREFEESDSGKPEGDSWLHLSYDWLKTSADRARVHLERGNAAARLVVSYCARQTDWSDPNDERCRALAIELTKHHPDAVRFLLEQAKGKVSDRWLTSADEQSLLLFVLQNKGAVALLKAAKGMAVVEAAIRAGINGLGVDNFHRKRAVLDICPDGWENYGGTNKSWPVYFRVRGAPDTEDTWRFQL